MTEENEITEVKKESKPSWVKMKPVELEKIVVELAKSGESSAKIGLILRDKHGVPRAKLLGKKIEQILKENNVKFKGEKNIVSERVGSLKAHILKNKNDYPASRALAKKLWVVNRFEKASA